jgi:hypothetical protein
MLNEEFDIDCIVDRREDKYMIRLRSDGSRRFLEIVRPWVEQVSGMKYKLGYGR